MIQEDKNLLIKDLSARVPHGIKIKVNDKIEILQGINSLDNVAEYYSFLSCDIEEVKPYLFPMSSMTKEQKKYISDRWGINEDFNFEINPDWRECLVLTLGDMLGFVNWLIENHFDVNDLIPMGLAIDATNLNIY